MYKRIIALAVLLTGISQVKAQDIWFTRTGNISFHAGTSVEDIDGVNNEVASLINVSTGDIAFTVLVKSFHFTRSLMEEHFNENYLESTKFPKSTFSGKITDPGKVNFAKDGNYPATVEGDLTIHGVTRKISAPATIKVAGGKISANAAFKILMADYNVAIPGVVADKISKEAAIEVKCNYEKKN
jgi:polyisoprenoid-binding protein YceI